MTLEVPTRPAQAGDWLLQPAVDPPTPATPCDRCEHPLGERIYALSQFALGGVPATWWVCASCHHEFGDWFFLTPPGRGLSGT